MIDQSEVIELDLPAIYKYLNVLSECLAAMLVRVEDLPEQEIQIYNIQLAVQEVCTNIVDHAYAGMEAGRIKVTLSLLESPKRLSIELRDTGNSFDPSLVAEPDLEVGQVHGFGLFLLRILMDEVNYEPLYQSNCWRLIKVLEGPVQAKSLEDNSLPDKL